MKEIRKILFLSIALTTIAILIIIIFPSKFEQRDLYAQYTYNSKALNKDKITTINIEIDESDFADLLENPLNETYYASNVVINGERINNVAIRAKGNSSLSRVASDDESDRYSFKIDFDKYEEQSFYGLKKLCLNNNYTDSSSMREYIAYSLMKEMNIPTPDFAYTHIYINGEEWGLYLGVEAIDETFLQNNFNNSDGDLFKPDGINLSLDENGLTDLLKESLALKTNENSSDYKEIEKLLETINNTDTNLEDVLDMDEILRYFALNTALVSLDSYQGNMLHNYYLYEQDGVFSIIPWDYDLSFGAFGVGMGGGNRGGEMPSMNNEELPKTAEIPFVSDNESQTIQSAEEKELENPQNNNNIENRQPREGGMGGGMQMNSSVGLGDDTINFPIDTPVSGYDTTSYPLINSWIKNEEYLTIYHNYLEKIVNSYLNESYIKTLVAKTANLIGNYVVSDPNNNYTEEEFVSGYTDIISFAKLRRESIKGQLLGDIDSTKESSGESRFMGFGNRRPDVQINDENINEGNELTENLPPNMNRMGMGGPPNLNNGGMRGMRNGEQEEDNTQKNTMLYLICGAIFIPTQIFASKFRRRGKNYI